MNFELPDNSVAARLYRYAKPFPHALLDDFFPADVAEELAMEARLTRGPDLYVYENSLEKKRALDDVRRMLPRTREAHALLASPVFLRWLETLTGIEGLVPDPYLRGGGVHLIPPGGKLDVHVDFNVHPVLGLHRRLNAIVYLNPGWTEEQGGHLELWSGYSQRTLCLAEEAVEFVSEGSDVSHMIQPCEWRNVRTLVRCERRILPIANRLVVFNTTETSYHGHPNPTRGQDWRCSLSAYYYTAASPSYPAEPHSTAFVRRPEDPADPEAEELRRRRERGRLTSNVAMEGRKD